jgi:hypothetical protein
MLSEAISKSTDLDLPLRTTSFNNFIYPHDHQIISAIESLLRNVNTKGQRLVGAFHTLLLWFGQCQNSDRMANERPMSCIICLLASNAILGTFGSLHCTFCFRVTLLLAKRRIYWSSILMTSTTY